MKIKNKTKATALIVIFITLTFFDCLFTYIGTPDLSKEANPLVRRFGLGWPALIVSNLLVLGIFCLLVWYSYVIYQSTPFEAFGFRDFIKKIDKRRKHSSFVAALGYAMGFSMILGRLMPVVEWAVYLAGYIMRWYENLKGKIPFQRPDLWATGFFAVVFCVVWYIKEYRSNQRNFKTYAFF